jgi:hypothetical protein
MLLAAILVQVVSFTAWWYGGWAHFAAHFGLGLLGVALLNYTAYWDPPPPDLRSRRIQLIVMSILVATMFNAW